MLISLKLMNKSCYQSFIWRRPVNQHNIASTLILIQQNSGTQKAMKQILFLILIIFPSTATFPAFQSVLERIPSFSPQQLNYYVNTPFQGSLIHQNYWEPRRTNRINYFNQYSHYATSLNNYPIYLDPFGPSRHTKDIIYLREYARTMNGANNNEKHSNYCVAQTPLSRSTPPYYLNKKQPITSQYNPRIISNQLGSATYPLKLNKDNVTMAFTIWGQFLDHDISLSRISQQDKMDIQIPKCDPFMDIDCSGDKFIPFQRSLHTDHSGGIDQMNSVTGWIDASMIYGSDEEVAHRLRTFENGKLKTNSNNFLPQIVGHSHKLPDAGDERAAENLLLLSYHTIFVREHNRLCDIMALKDPEMTDQQIYEAARNYVVGLVQKITFDDFLPILLGKEGFDKLIGRYQGYNQNIDPTILNQFSTIAYRFGHAIIVGRFPLINKEEEIEEELKLNEIFFKPDLLTEDLLEKVLRGLTYTITKQKDGTIIDQIRNLLITGPEHRDIHLDLFALNIQRAIDHGLEKYNYLRKVFGLEPLKTFTELTDDPKRAKLLHEFYHGDINKMDPWVGIINEKSINGGILGELGSEIVGTTFKNLRNGDRFWYENVLNHNVLPEIKGTFLSEIFIRNTNIENLQEDIFHYKTSYSRTVDSN